MKYYAHSLEKVDFENWHKLSEHLAGIAKLLQNFAKQINFISWARAASLLNESYFAKLMIQMVIGSFGKNNIELDPESAKYINTCWLKEYINEYQGNRACLKKMR